MQLELTTEQVNQILNALAQQPYIQVHDLINTIKQQGQQQLQMQEAQSQEKNHTPNKETAVQELVAEAATPTNGKKN